MATLGKDFIDALIANGLLPDECISVSISASVGDVMTIAYKVFSKEGDTERIVECTKILRPVVEADAIPSRVGGSIPTEAGAA